MNGVLKINITYEWRDYETWTIGVQFVTCLHNKLI